MRLKQYLRADLVLTGLRGGSAADVIATLSRHLASTLQAVDGAAIEAELLERERAHTTAMGQGVALPHATVEGLREPVLMLARARDEVRFGPDESPPVWLFFVLLSPPGREREHIKLLARICRLVRHPGFLDELRAASDGEEILRTIERIDAEHV